MIFWFRKGPDAHTPPGASAPPLEPGNPSPGLAGATSYYCECLDCHVDDIGGVATAIAFQMRHLLCRLRVTNMTLFATQAAQLVAETEQFLAAPR